MQLEKPPIASPDGAKPDCRQAGAEKRDKGSALEM